MEQKVNVETKDNQEMLDRKVNQDWKELWDGQDVMEQMAKRGIQE